MKILTWSDIQYNNWQEFSRILPNGLNSRFQDQLNVQEEIFDYANANGADIMVHDGDLFENRTDKINTVMYMTVFERFVEFAKKSSALIILLAGNHDFITKVEDMHVLTPFKKIENIIVADQFRQETVGSTLLSFIPYTKIGFRHKVNEAAVLASKYKPSYLFTHQGIRNALTGPRDTPLTDEYTLEDFRLDAFDIVFNGHYHKPQALGSYEKYTQGYLQIVGSSLQKDFGERNDEKGFCFLDTEKARTPLFVKTHGPRFFKIEVNKQEDLLVPKGFSNYDYLWVVSHGPDSGAIEDELERQGVNLGNTRIEAGRTAVKAVRTEISLNMSIETQMRHAIEYMLHIQHKQQLDGERILKMALEKYQKSLEV